MGVFALRPLVPGIRWIGYCLDEKPRRIRVVSEEASIVVASKLEIWR
jgi:hypothetical protein